MSERLIDRISTQLFDEDTTMADVDEFRYSFIGNDLDGGYEKVFIKLKGSGSLEFQGAYHPNVVCEGGGVCIHCGRTLEFG
jgi:hypothetical protein